MKKYPENSKISFYFHFLVAFFALFCFANSASAAGTVSFTTDAIVSLTGISNGDLYAADTSQAGSISVSGTALAVSAIPDGDSFILKTADHDNALKLTPSGGTVDLDFDSADLSAGEITEWTLTGTGSVSVAQVVGVPSANTWYAIKIGGTTYNSYQSNVSSEVSFTYSGGWSSKVFTIEETTAPANGGTIELDDDDDDDDDDHPNNLDISHASYTAYSNRIIVQWKTSRDANSHVEYGTSGDLGKEEYNSRKVQNHKITLADLDPDTLYYFRMKSTDEYDNGDRTKIHSARTKSAVNWGIDASGFFFDQNKGDSSSEKSVTEKIGELPEKIAEKIGEQKFFSADIFKSGEKLRISEIKFKIVDKEEKPIPGLEVALYSEPKKSTTDMDGVAIFEDVELGRHTLVFAYQGEEFKKRVKIGEDDYNEGKVNVPIITVKAEKDKRPWWEWAILALLIVIIIMSIIKRRRAKGIAAPQ